jgi:hypothetical protein
MPKYAHNYTVDPWDSDTAYPVRIQSEYYTGDWNNITTPAAANFPPTESGETPTRYLVDLPGIIDVSDLLGARQMLIRNVTDGVNMTRVTGAPGNNEYRVPPATSGRRSVIEINGLQANKVIGYDYYMIGSILNEVDATDPQGQTLLLEEGLVARYVASDLSTISTKNIYFETLEIGAWDMDTAATKTIAYDWQNDSPSLDLPLTGDETPVIQTKTGLGWFVSILSDAGEQGRDASLYDKGFTVILNPAAGPPAFITLSRTNSGTFDNFFYSDSVMNRGYITFIYIKL